MTKAEQLADVIREMRPSELLSQKLVDRIQRALDDACEDGRSTQAILELQGRKRFLDEVRANPASFGIKPVSPPAL